MSNEKDDVAHEYAPESQARREFVALSAAVGLAAAAQTSTAATPAVVEENVEIRTPDGTCDAAFFHPATGTYPGVLVWTDIFGLRPAFRDMGKRLAAEGYAVLVPNPFYRTKKSPVFGDISKFNFADPATRASLGEITGPLNAPGAAEKDAAAYVAWLDTQKSVNKSKKMGTQGYCMGGPLVFKTLAGSPSRVGAGGTFHGGGLVTANPGSPHLLIPKMKAKLYIAVAGNDDQKEPDTKVKLKEAFAAANVPAEIEVFSQAQHGWCMKDAPGANGPIYKEDDAEKAWAKLLTLYKTALA